MIVKNDYLLVRSKEVISDSAFKVTIDQIPVEGIVESGNSEYGQGQEILFSKEAGIPYTIGGENFLLLRNRDVFAVLNENL